MSAQVQANTGMDALDSGDDLMDRGLEEVEEVTQAPANTPVNADSGHTSPVMQSSSENLGDETQKQQTTIAAQAPPTPQAQTVEVKEKKDGKKDEKKKTKKREDKGHEYILRALNSLNTPEEKLAALCKKYADLHEEHRVLQTSFKTQQRTMVNVMREKDGLQSEHTKAMMGKSKLESLCRELQKQNKVIKDESIKRAREEDERRKEISAQFQTTIGEIQAQMTDNTERNAKLRSENQELAVQLQNIIKQCDARESQIDKVRKQHDLEQQLAEAKLSKSDLQLKELTERSQKEKELLISKFTEQAKKNSMLEAQVEMFKERYDDFEKLHSRSSETFQKYKTEMDKMTKRIKKLEKDGMQWKQKWESSNKALLDMMEARNKAEAETITYVQKSKKLESLCRAMQAELHSKKTTETVVETTPGGSDSTDNQESHDSTDASSAPPNSPDSSSTPQQCCDDSAPGAPPSPLPPCDDPPQPASCSSPPSSSPSLSAPPQQPCSTEENKSSEPSGDVSNSASTPTECQS